MQLKHVTTTDINMAEFIKAVKNGVAAAGDRIRIEECEWKILEITPDSALLWKCAGPGDDMPINKNGSNEYEGSGMQKYLREEFPETVPQELREAVTDEGFFLLSKEEVEKYMPREIDRIYADEDGDTRWWWTRSASRGYANYTWHVSTGGYVGTTSARSAARCAPACRIKLRPGLQNQINLIIPAHTCAGEGGNL